MKREIKFKAKRNDVDDEKFGEWVEGDLVYGCCSCFLSEPNDDGDDLYGDCDEIMLTKVDRDTVCQFTEYKCKNSVEIFDGDLLFYFDTPWRVFFNTKTKSFWAVVKNKEMGDIKVCPLHDFSLEVFDVVGNIHD